MAGSLFISHASGDAKVAAELCDALEGRGFDCWLASRDVAPGENFQVAIVRAIRGARMLLLVFTGAANSSDEVAKELALASQAKIPVVPLKVEDVAPSEALAYEFATRQWIDFHTDWTRAVEQLARHVSNALGIEATTAPPSAAPAAPPSPPVPESPASAAATGSRPWPPAGRALPGDPRPDRARNRSGDRDRARQDWRDDSGVRLGERAVQLAIERAKARRASRSASRSMFNTVRGLMIALAVVLFFVVLLPWLRRLTEGPAHVNAPAPVVAATPANVAPSNSEVPF
jgi:hypothetical protein